MKPGTRLRLVTLAAAGAALVLLGASPAAAQLQVRAGDGAFLTFGTMVQAWADWQQLAGPGGEGAAGTQQNLFLRRARLQLAGRVVPEVSFYFVFDASNVGKNKAPGAAPNATLSILDAFVRWRLAEGFQLQAGLFLVPLGRSSLLASSRLLALDYPTAAFSASAPTQTNSMRDTGFGATGFFLRDRLQYRVGVFQGARDAASRNPLRYAARVQYELLDTEPGYLRQGYNYGGTYIGEKKVLAVGVASDNQASYHSYAADLFAEVPLASGDAPALNLGWVHYDGEDFLTSLPRQEGTIVEAGYYVSRLKAQPFLQAQSLLYADPVNRPNGWRRWQVGLHYYVAKMNLKLTGAFTRTFPVRSTAAPLDQLTIQVQAYYY